MKRESWTVSDLHLEQYVLGELTPRDMERVSEALAEDGALRARLAEIERSNREILLEYPPQRMVPLLRARASEEAPARDIPGGAGASKKPRAFTMIVLPAAAAALLFFSIATPVYLSRTATNGVEITRAKGEADIFIHVKTATGAEILKDGGIAKAGDVLQISYDAKEARYGVIFSVDGRGVITFHLPQGFAGKSLYAPELEHGGEISLSSSYELDNAPGFERFFIVSSNSRFDVRDVEKAARSLAANVSTAASAALRLPKGLNAASLLLKKQG